MLCHFAPSTSYSTKRMLLTEQIIPGRPKNGVMQFVLRPITLEILKSLYQIWHKSRSLHSEHHAVIYLNQSWKIVAPSGWRITLTVNEKVIKVVN